MMKFHRLNEFDAPTGSVYGEFGLYSITRLHNPTRPNWDIYRLAIGGIHIKEGRLGSEDIVG